MKLPFRSGATSGSRALPESSPWSGDGEHSASDIPIRSIRPGSTHSWSGREHPPKKQHKKKMKKKNTYLGKESNKYVNGADDRKKFWLLINMKYGMMLMLDTN